MMSVDEDALLCDLAETYGVYDLRSLPVKTIATLSAGLGENSRIMRKVRGEKAPRDILLLALIRDQIAELMCGFGMIESGFVRIAPALMDTAPIEEQGFDTPEDFMAARSKFLGE